MTLIFATNNLHKLHEVREKLRLSNSSVVVLSLSDIDFSDDLPETGNSLTSNALQKAETIFRKVSKNCFSDDTGLEIEALNGNPGVYSARYSERCAGSLKFDPKMSVSERNLCLVLEQMHGQTNRRACFRTVIALILEGKTHYFEGRVDGEIITEKRGIEGFGYDPIFCPDGYTQTFSELPLEMKNKISHRGKAIDALVEFLKINISK